MAPAHMPVFLSQKPGTKPGNDRSGYAQVAVAAEHRAKGSNIAVCKSAANFVMLITTGCFNGEVRTPHGVPTATPQVTRLVGTPPNFTLGVSGLWEIYEI